MPRFLVFLTVAFLSVNASAVDYSYSHFLGTTGGGGYADGVGTAARFYLPRAITVDKNGNTFVAEDATGRVAGFVMAGPARDDDAVGLGEVQAIYLDPGARGRGLGRALMDAAIEALVGAGFSTVVLWVLTANIAARRFYERAGFRLDGAARDLDFDGTPVEEIRYRRAESG